MRAIQQDRFPGMSKRSAERRHIDSNIILLIQSLEGLAIHPRLSSIIILAHGVQYSVA
jgi:hypothetical protein